MGSPGWEGRAAELIRALEAGLGQQALSLEQTSHLRPLADELFSLVKGISWSVDKAAAGKLLRCGRRPGQTRELGQ